MKIFFTTKNTESVQIIVTNKSHILQTLLMAVCLLFSLSLSANMCGEIGYAAKQTMQARHQGESKEYLMKQAAHMGSRGSRLIMERIINEAFNMAIPKSSHAKEAQISSFGQRWKSSCDQNT